MTENEDRASMTPARPRRSTRTPAKAPEKMPVVVAPPTSPAQGKRKARNSEKAKSPADKLEYLLTNPKSKLTKIDILDVINYVNFLELSDEAQMSLCSLLPPTAFMTYEPSVCPSHPDFRKVDVSTDQMDIDSVNEQEHSTGNETTANHPHQTPATFDPTFFTSPFFLSAARTFQDHLYSSWLGKKASDDIEKFMQGAKDGTLHADWKDEVWERDHRADVHANPKRTQLAGLDLTVLAQRGLVKEGDVLAYRRVFAPLNVVVEKDLLVDTISPHSHAITFLLPPGTQTSLDPSLLVPGTHEYDGKLLSIEDIVDPVALERGILDVDGRVGYSEKYELDAASCPGPTTQSGAPSEELRNLIAVRAWKALTVWRWSGDISMPEGMDMQMVQDRGGRKKVATLFYLRGCCTSPGGS